MSLAKQLRTKYDDLWERMVGHPFVIEMGDGTLPLEKFRAYFIQDYLFGRSMVRMVAHGIAKAPDVASAYRLNQFLTLLLDPENDLFVRCFRALDVPPRVYTSATPSPVTQAFGDFMARVAMEGDYWDVVTMLAVTEGTYLDWGRRLIEAGKRPENPVYQEWIDIHGPDVLDEMVCWTNLQMDLIAAERMPRADRIFQTTLRYEYLFWEEAYSGQGWPDE